MDRRANLDGERDREEISESVTFKLGSERWVESNQETSEKKHVWRSPNRNKLVKGIRNRSI